MVWSGVVWLVGCGVVGKMWCNVKWFGAVWSNVK